MINYIHIKNTRVRKKLMIVAKSCVMGSDMKGIPTKCYFPSIGPRGHHSIH